MTVEKWRDVWERFSGRGVYPHELAFLLDNPLRNVILSPQKLADYLHLSSNARVLEIGPGPGYFSGAVARRIPQGQLVLLDIQSEMLEKDRAKLSHSRIDNARFTQGNAALLPFGPNTFDMVFLVTVLGEVTEPSECLDSTSRVLRPDGLLSITEMKGDPDALSPDDILTFAEKSGLQFLEQFTFRGGYTLNLRKVAGGNL